MSDQDLKPNQEQPDQGTQEARTLFTLGERQYDEESAKKKILNADSFIEQLKQEAADKDAKLAELQAKLDQSTKLEDALQKMKESSMYNDQQTPTEAQPQMDVEALKEQLLKQAQEAATNSVSQYEQQRIAQANLTDSEQAAKRFYGTNYMDAILEEGAKLQLDEQAVLNMAKSNPALFKRTFGLTGNPKPQLNADGSVNTAGLGNVEKAELKDLGKQWGSSAKLKALQENTASVEKMLEQANGDVAAVAKALGIDI